MSRRRRRVFIETQKGRRSAGFTVHEGADAADVSLALRNRGWIAYRLRLDAENHAWVPSSSIGNVWLNRRTLLKEE